MAEQVCGKCGGSGWIVVEQDGISGAERCDCVQEDRARRLEENTGIPPLYQSASLENFQNFGNPAMSEVQNIVRAYTREYPFLPKPGLLLLGPPGSGKTHLAAAALRRLVARGFAGLFYDYQNLLDRIRAGYDASSGSSDREAYRAALDAEVLLLDDLGAHRVTDWVRHGHLDRDPPLQQQEGAHRYHQPARRRRRGPPGRAEFLAARQGGVPGFTAREDWRPRAFPPVRDVPGGSYARCGGLQVAQVAAESLGQRVRDFLLRDGASLDQLPGGLGDVHRGAPFAGA